MKKEIDWNVPCSKFEKHFKYYCNVPPDADILSEKDYSDFCELVNKCINDNIDYTAEKCGTKPSLFIGTPQIIVD